MSMLAKTLPRKEALLPNLVYCPACGAAALEESPAKRLHCRACDVVLYLNVAATASLVMRQGNFVLMTERGAEPARGRYDFPGGFVQPGESLEQGLRRELREELDFEPGDFRYLMSTPSRYPYRDLDYDLCDAYFILDLDQRPAFMVADDVAGCAWMALDALRPDQVSFPSVWKVIQYLQKDIDKT